MTFTIKTNWIKEIRQGYNANWKYDYKEYVFNENYTESAWIRIPLKAPGIKAMDYSTGQGIQAEYNQAYLDNDGVITTIFDIRYTDADHADHLADQVNSLTALHKDAMKEVKYLEGILLTLEATVQKQERETLILKAKLYDLMTAGA